MPSRWLAVLLFVVLLESRAQKSSQYLLEEQLFDLPRQAEVRATIHATCDRCAWDVEGREAVTLDVAVDGRYSQHVPLVRGAAGDYDILLGTIDSGRHVLRIRIDPATTSTALRTDTAATARAAIQPVFSDAAAHLPLSLAPIVYARPNTVGRFTDTPVFMWFEVEPTARGTRYRYSVIFTNEDGGTPTDRLMATWGRTTDIEYIYSVEVGAAGNLLADDYQGADHRVQPFRGTREGRHPLLWVSTDNNMVSDTGETRIRYAPAPVAISLRDTSREAVMDANPWLYDVMSRELKREGKIKDDPPPGQDAIPDPRRFVYIEACGTVGDAALALEVDAGGPTKTGPRWISSDRGMPKYRIVRDGCFRAAIPLPLRTRATDIRALRALAFDRPPGDAPPRARAGMVTLTRINRVFMLDDRFVPGPSRLAWNGSATISPSGPPFEIRIP